VRLAQWNRDGNGRLVLGRGWQRVVTTVPREQREAVSVLLEKKLAGNPIAVCESSEQ
jgi:hypothetical protein